MTVVDATSDAAWPMGDATARSITRLVARVEHVTVYTSGARVRRAVTISAPLPARVRITDLPLGVLQDTVRVEVGGPAIATSVRVGVDAPVDGDAQAEDSAELRTATRGIRLAQAEVERLDASVAVLIEASPIQPDASDEAPAAWAEVVAARRAVIALRTERELVLRGQLVAARRAVEESQRVLDAVLDREQRASTARPPKLHELRTFVEVELQASANSEIVIYLEYQVAVARWTPSYVARIDNDEVRLELRAAVAQDTGEDWLGVPIVLSTAEPERFAMLPELAVQKIGRRQQEVGKPGFRAPPRGAGALYMDYERALPAQHVGVAVAANLDVADDALSGEVWDEESSRAKQAFATPPGGTPMPQALVASRAKDAFATMSVGSLMPQLAASHAADGGAPRDVARGRASKTRKAMAMPAPSRPLSSPPSPRLDYGALYMAGPSSPQRGSLIPQAQDRHAGAIAHHVAAAQARISALPLPPGCHAAWAHAYDYAYATDGAIDVRGDGAWHSIAVTAHEATAKLRHVAVPREQADAFRLAAFANPFTGPLLPGPVDVYDRGRFLVTSEIEFSPPGALVEVGLGVDPAIKIARTTEFREEAAGMLRGALKLHHAITIDVENLSARAVELEVRERLPVTHEGDDEVEVTIGKIDPAWERWTPDPAAPRDQHLRGASRWTVTLAPKQKKTLRAAYEVKIAAKSELVGGNRRER